MGCIIELDFQWFSSDLMIVICQQAPPETANIFNQEFVQDGWTSTKTVMRRQITLVLRGRSFLYARLIQVPQPLLDYGMHSP